MLIIPAIDLKDGQCVRLKQGVMQEATVFSDNPAHMAQHWVRQGARRLHLVDLNGAFAGKPQNLVAIKDILATVPSTLPIQLGGGIRDLATIENYLTLGIHYIIIGTAAVQQPNLVSEACRQFPNQILVGIDAKNGQVATDGWAKLSNYNAIDLAKRYADHGVTEIIYTDIGRDGMLSGINIEATVQLAKSSSIPIIASGGLTNLDDIRTLCQVAHAGITGAITGRAIYEGSIDFQEAQSLADKLESLH